MKSVITNKYNSIHTRRRAFGCYIEPFLIWMQGLDKRKKRNKKRQKCGSYGECYKSFKLQRNHTKVLQEVDTTRSPIYRLPKHQATFFSQVKRREKLEHLVTAGMTNVAVEISKKSCWMDLKKVAKCRLSDKCTIKARRDLDE